MPYTKKSFETLDRIREACYKETRDAEKWNYEGKTYFYVEDAEDYEDGSVTGDICSFLPKSRAEKVGRFKIEADGEISKGRFGFKELGEKAKKK